MGLTVQEVPTKPISGQAPGTSGLRKAVKVYQQQNYLENFVQCTLTAALGNKLAGSRLIVGGDGRYFQKEATIKIIQMCAANGVSIFKDYLSILFHLMGTVSGYNMFRMIVTLS